MKLHLIKANSEPLLDISTPLGIMYLTSYIKQKFPDVEIKILDQISEKKLLKTLKKDNPDIVGFSSMSTNYYITKDLCAKAKYLLPNSIFIIGGTHVTVSPKSFKKSDFDVAVIGEGELTIEELIRLYKSERPFKENLKYVKGILFKEDGEVIGTGKRELIKDLNILPIPNRSLMNMKYYTMPKIFEGLDRQADIITSRGCPYKCIYCNSPIIWGRSVRFMSAEKVVEDIKDLYYNYKIERIIIQDDVFCINKPRIRKIIELLRQEGILGKIKFDVASRSNVFDREVAELFKELNVIIVRFGFESGSEKIISNLKGGTVTLKNHIDACKLCKEFNFVIVGYIMLGNPGETEEDLEKTYNFVRDHSNTPHSCQNIFRTTPLPNTELAKYALDNNLITEDYFDNTNPRFTSDDFNLLLSKDISRERFEHWYYRITALQLRPPFTGSYFRLFKLFLSPYFLYIKYMHLKIKMRKGK